MKKVFLIIFLAAIVTTACALPIAGAVYAMPAGGFDASSYGSRAAYMVDTTRERFFSTKIPTKDILLQVWSRL